MVGVSGLCSKGPRRTSPQTSIAGRRKTNLHMGCRVNKAPKRTEVLSLLLGKNWVSAESDRHLPRWGNLQKFSPPKRRIKYTTGGKKENMSLVTAEVIRETFLEPPHPQGSTVVWAQLSGGRDLSHGQRRGHRQKTWLSSLGVSATSGWEDTEREAHRISNGLEGIAQGRRLPRRLWLWVCIPRDFLSQQSARSSQVQMEHSQR